jgi:creatinine amidohydrolase
MDATEPKVLWMEMRPDELLRAIERCPLCYMAYGLAEPHGVYNALGLDWLKAQALAERAARAHGGVVAPALQWHVAERPSFNWFGAQGIRQPLCSGIPEDLFYHNVLHHVRTIDARGFRAAILLTGHYGGLENDLRLLCDFYTRRTGSPLRIRALADCEVMTYGDIRGDHAGICETSQLMALRPGLTDLGLTESASASGRWAGTDFPLSDGRMPSADLGEKIVSAQVERLGEIGRDLLAAWRPRPDWTAPTLPQAEELWTTFERLTRKYWWCSLTLGEYRQGKRVEFPGWEALGL